MKIPYCPFEMDTETEHQLFVLNKYLLKLFCAPGSLNSSEENSMSCTLGLVRLL